MLTHRKESREKAVVFQTPDLRAVGRLWLVCGHVRSATPVRLFFTSSRTFTGAVLAADELAKRAEDVVFEVRHVDSVVGMELPTVLTQKA
jgi:hypothetical protein